LKCHFPQETSPAQATRNLTNACPAFSDVGLGDLLNDLAAAMNTTIAAWNSFLAHLDASGNGAIGSQNAADFGVDMTAPPIRSL
jgi:hypothetical protein